MNRYRIILASALILTLLFSCAAHSRGVYHLVRENETLTAIARIYNCDIMAIARANHMKPEAMLKAGSVIFIPGANEAREIKPPEPVAKKTAPPNPPRYEESPRVTSPPRSHKDSGPVPRKASIAFHWPVKGKIVAYFGPQSNGLKNAGINIDAPEGTPVAASEGGTVIWTGPIKYFGRTVIIRHNNNFTTVYSNLKDIASREGDKITSGAYIATVGRDEQSGMPYLHFEIRYENSARNPLEYLTDAR